jgi:hypothetical protein
MGCIRDRLRADIIGGETMGILEIESTLECQDHMAVAVKVQGAIEALKAAMVASDGDPNKAICETSRVLAGLVDYADKCPGVWNEERAQEVWDLLKLAGETTEGHEPYHDKVVQRAERFLRQLTDLQQARKATMDLLGLMRPPLPSP